VGAGVCVRGVRIDPPGSGVVEGEMVPERGPLGDMRFAPTGCFGAERIAGVRFAGVALLGSEPSTRMIRVIRHLHHPGATIRSDLARALSSRRAGRRQSRGRS
jgi:hypothetical protein